MFPPSGLRPAPASGRLASRPLAKLLARAHEQRTTGILELVLGSRHAAVILKGGRVAAVRATTTAAYLGTVLYELGTIDAATLNETLQIVARDKRLHGEVLLERGAITQAGLDEALAEQTCRALEALFSFSDETMYALCEDATEQQPARDASRPAIDPWKAMWRGVSWRGDDSHVKATMDGLRGKLVVADVASFARFGFGPDEQAICDRLTVNPSTVAEIIRASRLAPARTRCVLYMLAVGQCLTRATYDCPEGPAQLGRAGVLARAHRATSDTPHAALGLGPGAGAEAIRAAFLRLARAWNPERLPPELEDVRKECEHVFEHVRQAYRMLTEPAATAAPKPAKPTPVPAPVSTSTDCPQPTRDVAAAKAVTFADVDAALNRGDLSAARTLARSLTATGTDGPAARAVLAWCACDGGAGTREAIEGAIAVLDRLLRGDPDCTRAVLYRGQLHARIGQGEASNRDFRKAIRLEPANIAAMRELRLSEMRARHEQRRTSSLRGFFFNNAMTARK